MNNKKRPEKKGQRWKAISKKVINKKKTKIKNKKMKKIVNNLMKDQTKTNNKMIKMARMEYRKKLDASKKDNRFPQTKMNKIGKM